MKDYSLQELKKTGTLKLSLGEIVTIKNIAIKHHFEAVAEKCREAERKITKSRN